jgi:hypothetical protein
MEALHELPDLLQRQGQLGLRGLDESRCLLRLALEPPADEVKVQGDRDEPLLGAVVEVPLDAPPLRVPRGDDACARLGQVPHRLAQVGDVAHDRNDLVGAAGHDARLEVLDRAVDRPQPVIGRRQLTRVERAGHRVEQRARDRVREELRERPPEHLARRVRQPAHVAGELEVLAPA